MTTRDRGRDLASGGLAAQVAAVEDDNRDGDLRVLRQGRTP